MAVKDYLKPLVEHRSGIPSNVMLMMRGFGPNTSRKMVEPLVRAYEKQVRLIEVTLEGKDLEGFPIPADKEELAAEMVAHQIVDTAYLHDRLRAAGAPIGEFPFDWVAEIILPRDEEDTNNGNDQ